MKRPRTSYTLIGPLVDDSYRVVSLDAGMNEIVWGTCEYWARKLRLSSEQRLLQDVFDRTETPQLFTADKREQLYPRQIAERAAAQVRRNLERVSSEARHRIN